MVNDLKKFMFLKYDGFADKRIKNIKHDRPFRLDKAFNDVQDHVRHVFARVIDADTLEIRFCNNPPLTEEVIELVKSNNGSIHGSQIIIILKKDDFVLIDMLRRKIRYGDQPYYSWARDRVCEALDTLIANLKQFSA